MFCKSLTMHTHLHKLWLAFGCVLRPGPKSTSCDDTGGPSVESLHEVEQRIYWMTLNDFERLFYFGFCCRTVVDPFFIIVFHVI